MASQESVPPLDVADWIEHDDLLRDEAVVHGWAHPRTTQHILDSIRFYYRQKSAAAVEERVRLQHQDETVVDLLASMQPEIERSEQSLREAETALETSNAHTEEFDVLRYGAGLFLVLLICGVNYIVVYELLAPTPPPPSAAGTTASPTAFVPFLSRGWVALAVLLLGMFTMFSPTSIFYRRYQNPKEGEQDGEAEQGKVWVAEVAPAVAASLFTAVWGYEPSLLHTVASFFFVLALFMFAGKLFLSLLPRFSESLRRLRAYRSQVSSLTNQREAHMSLIAMRDERNRVRMEIARAIRLLPSAEELKEVCQRKVELFCAEAELARAAAFPDRHAGRAADVADPAGSAG